MRFIDQMNEQIALYTDKKETLEQIEPRVVDLSETYNEVLYELWKKLMTLEMQLYEQCEVRWFILRGHIGWGKFPEKLLPKTL